MKTKYLWLFFSFLSVFGCDREGSVVPSINLISNSECKGKGLKAVADHSSDQDCIQYTWVSGDTLIIKHMNAGFNCCPDGFRVELKIVGDTLVITEVENASMCDCNCLFDLNYNLTGISKDTWWIRIEEPYVQQPEEKKILFKTELRKNPDGEFCVTRTGYPWKL
ncbi:MAG: hypothetical protein D4R64_06560 [Porphyromonadaceae bacterium]|nr:MAG: hypothetical protein D4R64_06560 [Porphyromonadaceae bacterium]